MRNTNSMRPKYTNNDSYLSDTFPRVIGFCDRDDSSHLIDSETESYEYKLNNEIAYRLMRKQALWEFEEYLQGRLKAVSSGPSLNKTLYQAFIALADEPMEGRCKIMIPVEKKDVKNVMSLMYFLGGYMGSWMQKTLEMELIIKNLVNQELQFLCFSRVPLQYVNWLSDVFLQLGIIGQDEKRVIWIYNVQENSSC